MTSEFTVRRSEFGMDVEPKALGDDISVIVGIEAAKK